jgi:hypothetical protein
MRQRLWSHLAFTLGLAAALLACPRVLSAQIISSLQPVGAGSGGASGPAAPTFHVMGGFTNWEFGFDAEGRQMIEDAGGTVTGGRNGFILAGDISFRVSGPVSVGAGGWYNKVTDFVVSEPDFTTPYELTITRAVSSIYGNVFYKHFGVQAGIIPARGTETIVVSGVQASEPSNQTDANIVGVARFGSSSSRRPWQATAAAGVHIYGTIAANDLFQKPESPRAQAFTTFVNGSVGLVGGLSLDASFWYVGEDKNYAPGSRVGNASQTRFTIGVGYGR